jgi:uncharacterized protein YbbC (DUF1343 family)/CubicO group peptidase (beta-lactamase class C family)
MRSAAALLLLLASAAASARPFDRGVLRQIDGAIETAIAEKKLPGGVFHLERDGVVYEKAYGRRAVEPAPEGMTRDTIFDLASLTKVTATTPAIWLLIQRGKIGLDERVSAYSPQFRGGWRDEVTVRHLLTHTSGLRPDLDLETDWSGHERGIALALAEEPRNRPGVVFRYSDINFELLGAIVEAVAGEPLNVFVEREIFKPLGMSETRFQPPRRLLPRIAPTERTDGVMLRGVVHDPTARRMEGVAGHAGLFSTARDLARYARMLLRGGAPLFRPEIVKMMTTVQSPAGVAVRRAGGFDYDSSFSRPRGDLFPIGSYGHTGFTGTILWIDPASHTFYLFLSNRVHPDGKGVVTALQRTLGTLAARAAGYTQPVPRRVEWVTGGGDAANGIDVLAAHGYDALRGRRIGLITNHSGIDKWGNPTADLLRSAPGVNVVAFFSPEHGFRGSVDESVDDSSDPASGLPVYSLYGKNRQPTPAQLAGIDTLVFDIQDAGVRFYTYIATLSLALQAAADAHVRFVVLDRVNPINGVAVEGPLLQGPIDFTAPHPIPVRHGMTVGELARMIEDERGLDLDLDVVKVERWKREQWQDDAGLPWINPSPNLRSLDAAALYPGVALPELANVSVGRGTATPFEHLGAPWMDGRRLAAALPPLAGVRVEPVRFTPASSRFAGQECSGVRFVITDRAALRPLLLGASLLRTIYALWPAELKLDDVDKLLRDPRAIAAIREGKPLEEIVAPWAADEAAFRARRAKYLLY